MLQKVKDDQKLKSRGPALILSSLFLNLVKKTHERMGMKRRKITSLHRSAFSSPLSFGKEMRFDTFQVSQVFSTALSRSAQHIAEATVLVFTSLAYMFCVCLSFSPQCRDA